MRLFHGFSIVFCLSLTFGQFPTARVDSLLKAGNYDEIIRICTAELGIDSTNYNALFNAARAEAFKKNYDRAITLYSTFLLHYPRDPDGHLGRGRVFSWTGRYPEAEQDFLFVTDSFPDYRDAWLALGSLYQWWHQPEKAISVYSTLLESDPTNANFLFIRGKQYLALQDPLNARKDFIKALNHGGDAEVINPLITSLGRIVIATSWSAGMVLQRDLFKPGTDTWTALSAKILHNFTHGTGLLYITDNSRYGKRDQALLLDAYFDLWPGAYGNWTHQVALGADFLPLNTYRLEIIQSIGIGWEVSGSYGHMNFSKTKVDLYSLMGGKYRGNWYLRLRYLLATSPYGLNHSFIWSSRRYLSNADNFVDLTTGISTKLFKNVYLGDALSESGAFFLVGLIQHKFGSRYLVQGQYAYRRDAASRYNTMHSFLFSVDYLF